MYSCNRDRSALGPVKSPARTCGPERLLSPRRRESASNPPASASRLARTPFAVRQRSKDMPVSPLARPGRRCLQGHWSLQQPFTKHEHTCERSEPRAMRRRALARPGELVQRALEENPEVLFGRLATSESACALRRTRPAPRCQCPFVAGGTNTPKRARSDPPRSTSTPACTNNQAFSSNPGTLSPGTPPITRGNEASIREECQKALLKDETTDATDYSGTRLSNDALVAIPKQRCRVERDLDSTPRSAP